MQAEQQADELLNSVLSMMQHTLHPYTEYLLPEMVTTLVNEFSILFANRLEISLVKMKYSQQGVLAIDRIVRGVCNELITEGGSEIRTNFGKISTIVAILSCDDVGMHSLSVIFVLHSKYKRSSFAIIHISISHLDYQCLFTYCRREG